MMHQTKITVRGYHVDMYQHVNNARYLEFLEEARWQYVESILDLSEFMKKGMGFVVVNININYRSPATIGQVLVINSQGKAINKSSATIHQDIYVENTDMKVADADITFVIVDLKTGKPVPLSGEILTWIRKF